MVFLPYLCTCKLFILSIFYILTLYFYNFIVDVIKKVLACIAGLLKVLVYYCKLFYYIYSVLLAYILYSDLSTVIHSFSLVYILYHAIMYI